MNTKPFFSQNTGRFSAPLTHLQRFKEEGNEFLEAIVTGDDTWVHHFTPETVIYGMETSTSPRKQKCKAALSATVFGDAQGVILLLEFMKSGATIKANSYCAIL